MIPALVSVPPHPHTILPPGLYPASLAEFHNRFVVDFPGSATRQSIFEGFANLKREVHRLALDGYHILDGSFITGKNDPVDLDLVTVISASSLAGLDVIAQAVVTELLGGREATEKTYRCHAFLVVLFPRGHRFHAESYKHLQETADFFSKTNKKKTGVEIAKGLVRVEIGDQDFDSLQQVPMGENEGVVTSKVPMTEEETHWDSDALRERLDAVESLLGKYRDGSDNNFAVQLQIQSLEEERVWLLDKIAAARLIESDYYAEVSFNGPSTNEHEIDAGLLGKFLVFVQDLSSSFTRGHGLHRLNVALKKGSFKVLMRLVEEPSSDDSQSEPERSQLVLDEMGEDTANDVIGLDVLASLFEKGADKPTVIGTLETRAMKRTYSDMMRLLENRKIDVHFRTRINPDGTRITSRDAGVIYDWLNEQERSEYNIVVYGELRGANLNKGPFEILSREGNSYTGSATPEARELLRGVRLGQTVRAVIKVTKHDHINLDAPEIKYKLEIIETTDVLDLQN